MCQQVAGLYPRVYNPALESTIAAMQPVAPVPPKGEIAFL